MLTRCWDIQEFYYSERKEYENGTVKQRIIAYLSELTHQVVDAAPYSTLPRKVCQEGIAEGVGISRAHATLELSILKEEGVVDEKLAHVQGSCRRRKVYYLNEVNKHGE